MANWKKIKQNALASVDTAIHIAERIPEPEDNQNIDFSYDNSVNPFPFLLDLLRRFCGYNYMIKIIARFIAFSLPMVETAVKAALLANLKNLLYCTIDPRFKNNEVLRNGITIDLEDIDILHTLQYCPLKTDNLFGVSNKNYGSMYYYGCDCFNYPSELSDAADFNAFLWYVINRSNKREVWRGIDNVSDTLIQTEYFGNIQDESCLIQKELKERPSAYEKDLKDNGILTVIYYGDGFTTPRDVTGAPIPNEIRRSDILQVYIGNSARYDVDDSAFKSLERVYQQKCSEVFELEKEVENYKKQKSKLENLMLNIKDPSDLEKQKATYEKIDNDLQNVEKKLSAAMDLTEAYAEQYEKQKSNMAETYAASSYKDVTKNYYYDKTLMHFNYDYIMSIKLFDSKVVAAQLIDSLFNNLSGFNIHLSYQQRVIEEEVKKMVESVLETGDTTISDCFFAFSNKELDNLQRKVELQRAGLFSLNGESDVSSTIDIDTLYYNINNIASNATQEEIQSVIEGTLTNISKEFSSMESHTKTSYSAGVKGFGYEAEINQNGTKSGSNWDFIKQLIENLMVIVVKILCSPKVYLIYLINMRMLGEFDNNFNLEKFLQFKGELVAATILKIRDIWADYLTMVFKDLSKDLEQMIRAKLINEQYEYFRNLILQCIECFKLNKKYLDFNLDDVDYADILSDEITNEDNGC